jgi:hypothetical protein
MLKPTFPPTIPKSSNAGMADIQEFHTAAVMTLVTNTTVEGVLFGIGFTLYCMCVKLLCHDIRKDGWRRKAFRVVLLVYSSLIVLFTLAYLVNDVRGSILLYIDQKGAVQTSTELESSETQDPSSIWLRYITLALVIILTAAMQVITLIMFILIT